MHLPYTGSLDGAQVRKNLTVPDATAVMVVIRSPTNLIGILLPCVLTHRDREHT